LTAHGYYKAMGSFWNYLHCGKRPTHAVHGTKWPPCQCLGAAFSPDGVRWNGPRADESKQNGGKGDLPGLNNVGQDDGALDLAIWDDDLDGGSYWGLVRVDASGKNHRRTGRWTSKDFINFTAAEQVFQGSGDDDQVYTMQPFRLPQWPKGHYLATAQFFAQDEQQGWVRCELMQTLDFGRNWTRLARGKQFIPLGNATGFDSHTLYTAWSGGQAPLLNPKQENETMFYYAGGDGPHTGQRDDSIGLARAVTHAYAGLRVAAGEATTPSRLTTGPIDDLLAPPGSIPGGLSILAGLGAGVRIRVGVTTSVHSSGLVDLVVPDTASGAGPRWLPIPGSVVSALHRQRLLATTLGGSCRLVIEVEGPTMLFALRSDDRAVPGSSKRLKHDDDQHIASGVTLSEGGTARAPQSTLHAAHVFWASDETRSFASSCARPCGWLASDEAGNFVAEGKLGEDGSVTLSAPVFGVGWFGIEYSRPGVNATTAAILRAPVDSFKWPMQETPVAIDTAQAWLVTCDYPSQLLVSQLAAAAGCGWTRDRLRWSDLEYTRGNYAAPGATCYDNATKAAAEAGVRVLEVFHATPAWAVNSTTDANDGCDGTGTNMPRDLRDVYSFTAWLSRRFPDIAVEPWNEHNGLGFGGETTDQAASYQKAAYLGLKTTLKPPFVCNNVLAGAGTELTSRITELNQLSPYFQSYNIHSYDAVENYEGIFEPAAELAHRLGTPLWLTECGVHLRAIGPGPWADMSAESDLAQAQFIGPSFAAAMHAGVSKHFFFVLSNYLERGYQSGRNR
jgi:hypothetical protein